MWLSEVKYDRWEAKHGIRLAPRRRRTGEGCNGESGKAVKDARELAALARVEAWRNSLLSHVIDCSADMWTLWQVEAEHKCLTIWQRWTALQALRQRSLACPEPKRQPAEYTDVLRLLRELDASGSWPASSQARQRVIEGATLVEGGGRGGSFSVGCLPPPLTQPKANEMFPGG